MGDANFTGNSVGAIENIMGQDEPEPIGVGRQGTRWQLATWSIVKQGRSKRRGAPNASANAEARQTPERMKRVAQLFVKVEIHHENSCKERHLVDLALSENSG
ncbi:hypothetical protein BKA70DRAFT_1238756 [Coprinopsis sp. MPI-PUGE-AT-0042]|nr:hypothetical protein BKA70DRAFT_1238756 [Coprinopsis sp. MPI-PUGE-AT-0042]